MTSFLQGLRLILAVLGADATYSGSPEDLAKTVRDLIPRASNDHYRSQELRYRPLSNYIVIIVGRFGGRSASLFEINLTSIAYRTSWRTLRPPNKMLLN